jgi:hypothetical protein
MLPFFHFYQTQIIFENCLLKKFRISKKVNKMKNEKCVPLEMVEKYNKRYPKAWQYLTICHGLCGTSEETKWDPICYVPISAAIDAASDFRDFTKLSYTEQINIMPNAVTLSALASWRIHKQIFEFDEDMEEILYEQADDIVIPVDVLRSLPYPCIYIKTKKMNYDGFFAFFESDLRTGQLELRFLPFFDNGVTVDLLPIYVTEGLTVKEGLQNAFDTALAQPKTMKRIQEDSSLKDELEKQFEKTLRISKKLMQLVLYICAQNAEIAENPDQKKIYRKPKSEDSIKDRYREVQKWDVGKQTGENIRKYHKNNSVQYASESNGTRTGISTPKKPHIRSGHWHHYWIGPHEGERKLVLRWLAPTFIHDGQNVEPTTNLIGIDKSKTEQKG